MIYRCQCCGFETDFPNGEVAFQEGWDAPPHFSGYVSCNLCPGAWIVLRTTHLHQPDHERWVKHGRPVDFEIPRDADGKPIL